MIKRRDMYINIYFALLILFICAVKLETYCLYTSPCSVKDRNATLVTALYDIHRGEWEKWTRSLNEYFIYFEQVLRLDIPMIVFVEADLVDIIEEKRKDKTCYTSIYIQEFSFIETYKLKSDITRVIESGAFRDNNEMLDHPEGYSVDYLLITNNKVEFVKTAALRNPFKTSHFYWLDAGYGHGNDIFPDDLRWAPCNLLVTNGAITFITFFDTAYYSEITKNHALHKRAVHPLFVGGFFGGDKEAVLEYADIYKAILVDSLLNSVIDDDQGIATLVYYNRPRLFNLVNGDWYGVFKLFH